MLFSDGDICARSLLSQASRCCLLTHPCRQRHHVSHVLSLLQPPRVLRHSGLPSRGSPPAAMGHSPKSMSRLFRQTVQVCIMHRRSMQPRAHAPCVRSACATKLLIKHCRTRDNETSIVSVFEKKHPSTTFHTSGASVYLHGMT